MSDRNLKLINNLQQNMQIISNKTIMQYIMDYTKDNKLKQEIYNYINYIRLHK